MAEERKPVAPPPKNDANRLRERAVIVKLRQGCYQGFGVDQEIGAEIAKKYGADEKSAGHYNKRYMTNDFPPLKRVRDAITDARRTFKKWTFSWDEKSRILPAQNILDFKREMAEKEQAVVVAANEFCANFRKYALAQKPRLQGMWKETDYPSDDELQRKFKFVLVIEPIPTKDDFRVQLSAEQEKEIKEDYDEEIRARMKGAVQEQFANVRELVEQLISKTDKPDKRLQNKTFGPLRRIVGMLRSLNTIVQDPQITALQKQLANDLLKVDVAGDDEKQVRKNVRQKADALLNTLKPFEAKWN